ncbi:MAG: cytochrome P450 [Mycobacterium sp.]|nr:cytochrome P450 [Mycobacterium sp.]
MRDDGTSLPPGPRLPSVAQLAALLRDWPGYAAKCERRYGKIFTLRVAAVGTIVYLADPDHIKQVFAGSPRDFHAGEANSMLLGLVGEHSVLLLDDDVHADRRRLMLGPFTRGAVDRQAGTMATIAAESIRRWPVGADIAVAPYLSALTLEVILQTVIGTTDPVRLTALRGVMPKLLDLNWVAALSIARPDLHRFWPWTAVRNRLAEADRLIYAEIADRRADPDIARRTDVLAMLIRAADTDGRHLTDRELRDQLMTLLAAGHDTTATGLAWTLERLVRHPDVLAKSVAAAHASAAGDPAGDEYLDALIKEVLRIRPVVFDVGRVLTAPAEIGGYRLPKGVMVAPGVGLVHASADQYRDPQRFDPDRMVGAVLGPTTWLPFGGGNRRCLGATFAMVEMRVVLREVLRRVELGVTTAPGERQRLKHVTLVPDRGARITVRARHDVPVAGEASSPTCPVHHA